MSTDLENRYDGPYPQEVVEQARQAEATNNKRKRYEAMIAQCAADLKRLDAILSSPALDEEQDTLDQTQGQKPVQRGVEKHKGTIPTNSGRRKTDLQAWLKEFVSDIHACSDAEELDALISSSDDMIAAVQQDLPGWWYGDERNPDYEAVAARIARVRKELTGEAAPSLI